jgi:hypothetical protein
MPSQKLVRCTLRRSEPGAPASVRYVPLEIFGLWEYLMSTKHGFTIEAPRASLWVDMEESPELAYGNSQFDRVTEVTAFVYSARDDMYSRVCRYFPTEECPSLMQIFLRHYLGERVGDEAKPQIREKAGIWLHRAAGAEAAAS